MGGHWSKRGALSRGRVHHGTPTTLSLMFPHLTESGYQSTRTATTYRSYEKHTLKRPASFCNCFSKSLPATPTLNFLKRHDTLACHHTAVKIKTTKQEKKVTLICAAPSDTYGAGTSRIRSHGTPASQGLAMTSPTPFLPSRVGAALMSDLRNLHPVCHTKRRSMAVEIKGFPRWTEAGLQLRARLTTAKIGTPAVKKGPPLTDIEILTVDTSRYRIQEVCKGYTQVNPLYPSPWRML